MRLLNEITNVCVLDAQHLQLDFADGQTFVLDFQPYAAEGGVYSRLADPDFFRQVRIGEGRGYLEWPDGLDFCADALRIDAEAAVSTQPKAS